MRHHIAGNRLGRFSSWRKATIRDIAKATLIRQRISTTKAKAKEARKLVDRLITLGKKGSLAHRRRAYAILGDHQVVSDLFNKTAPRFRSRNGGYTRIIPISQRRGDYAQLAYLELTEKEEIVVSKPRSAAAAKKDKVAATGPAAGAPKREAPAAKGRAEEKETKPQPVKTEHAAPPMKKEQKDQGKAEKKPLGGFKKIFQRKKPE